MIPNPKGFSEYLQRLRRAKGLTYRAAAEGSGIQRTSIERLEKADDGGKHDLSVTNLLKLSKFYGVPVETLIEKGGWDFSAKKDKAMKDSREELIELLIDQLHGKFNDVIEQMRASK